MSREWILETLMLPELVLEFGNSRVELFSIPMEQKLTR